MRRKFLLFFYPLRKCLVTFGLVIFLLFIKGLITEVTLTIS